jgi:asparagine synthase (glutamine-hydrolysing)
MCGIAGIVDLVGSAEPDRTALRRMTDAILHRGPDAGGEHFEPGAALGHRRLSIIDVATGQQPLTNEDGRVVVTYNGEIYNFRELVVELEKLGHVFRTRSDTEVIVHAWEEWGRACVTRFNGMFAFAVWDSRTRELFLARDRIGKKPLYYTLLPDGRLAFASELKALLTLSALRSELEPTAVEDYLAFGYVPDPRTVLRGVWRLPPATTLVARVGAPLPAPQVYWDLTPDGGGQVDEATLEPELLDRLRHAVKIRLMSEVPLGAFLSGGVDSSAIVAMMSQLSASPVKTCAIAFDDPAFDESAYAQRVATRYNTDHLVKTVRADDYDLIDALVEVYDEPFADSSAIPTYRVCELARQRVTVALSGDGGDENFAGYRRYRMHVAEERARGMIPSTLRRSLFGPLGRWYPKLDFAPRVFRAKTTFQALGRDSVDAYMDSISIVREDLRGRLLSEGFRRRLQGYRAASVMHTHAANAPRRDPLSLVQYLDFKTYLPGDILVKVDRASMASSLEVRVPMLDYQFVDWVFGLPPSVKLRDGVGKYALKKALRPMLDDDLLYRRKMGFAVPLANWFRGPLRERIRSALLEGPVADSGIFDRATVRDLVDKHASGQSDNSAVLWTLMMFGASYRRLFA